MLRMTRLNVLFICFVGSMVFSACRHSGDFSQSVKDFEESNKGKGHTALYFYPDVIRALNFDNDTSYITMVKDIKKLKIITFNSDKDSIKPEQIKVLAGKIRKESFVDLMQMKQDNKQILVFMQKENEQPREFLGMVYGGNSLMIIDLIGKVPISAISSLMSGNLKLSGISSILNSNKSPKTSKRKNEKHPRD